MARGARKWLAVLIAANFAATGVGAYAHLALHPHHFCPEHGRFEPDADDPAHPGEDDRHGSGTPAARGVRAAHDGHHDHAGHAHDHDHDRDRDRAGARPDAPPGHRDPLPIDDHHACPAMAFATTPIDVATAPAWMPVPLRLAADDTPPAARAHPARIAAFRLAPKASPPA